MNLNEFEYFRRFCLKHRSVYNEYNWQEKLLPCQGTGWAGILSGLGEGQDSSTLVLTWLGELPMTFEKEAGLPFPNGKTEMFE